MIHCPNMKSVVITCRNEDSPNITALLKNKVYIRNEFGNYVHFSVLVTDEDLDSFIENVTQAIQFMDKSTTVEVYSPDFVISPELNSELKKEKKKRKISPVEQLIDSADAYAKIDINTFALAAIASLVALTGLFLNNVGIIIGAMLLAPLLGPIYAFAISTSTGNRTNLLESLKSIGLFLGIIILIAFIVTAALSLAINLPLTPEILTRTLAAPIYVVMAILLGFAVMVALSRGISEGIAGVAVAAALLPPAAVVGISLAIHHEGVFGSLILTLENVGGLIAGSVIGAIALQITPRSYREKMSARTILFRILWVLIVLVLLLLFLSILPV
jgi:uncharacterized hydrophobic protein (TIGR00341 family)